MKQTSFFQNNLGASGWFRAGRYKMERSLYTLHRVTGLVLLLVFLAYLVKVTFAGFHGQNIWISTLLFVHSQWFGLAAAIFSFHALNGLRLSVQELGFMLGKPATQVYPYRDSLRRHRWLAIVSTITSGVLALVFLYVFFIVGVWR
jgi:succinate dehydrogenase / fumarate reductase cytochrome b subunit